MNNPLKTLFKKKQLPYILTKLNPTIYRNPFHNVVLKKQKPEKESLHFNQTP